MNVFSISAIQLATVGVSIAAGKRRHCFGVVVEHAGLTAIVLPMRSMRNVPQMLFLSGWTTEGDHALLALDLKWQFAKCAGATSGVIVMPVTAQVASVFEALPLDPDGVAEVDDGAIVLPARADRLLDIEHAVYLDRARPSNVGAPVLVEIAGKSEWAEFAGVFTGDGKCAGVLEIMELMASLADTEDVQSGLHAGQSDATA